MHNMYRSFVTCDDPKGVVECGTSRRSKSYNSQKMDHKINSSRTRNDRNTPLAGKEDMVSNKGIREEHRSPSTFQLLEVSRGAQKLNQMIESWSKEVIHDRQTEDIAKDLLKGALDLQESLIMLGKLQEASQYVAHSKKKQKEKPERGRIDEVAIRRSNSCRFGDQNYQMEFERPRLSVDGSSRDCTEKLKRAIIDGISRQNLLPHKACQEKAHSDRRKEKIYIDRRKLDDASDIPSTSSSQSLAIESRSTPTDSSIFQTVPEKKAKVPNLIARLMGLDDIPPKPSQHTPQKQLDTGKSSSQRRPAFDIEMPKTRKPQPVICKADLEQRTLKNILENMQFKGLLKSNSAKEFRSLYHQSSDSHSKRKLINDIPPIVLIKPRRVPCVEAEEALEPIVWKKGALTEGEPAFGSTDLKEGTLNASRVHYKRISEWAPIKRLDQDEGAKDGAEGDAKPEEKEIRTVDPEEGPINADEVHKKLKIDETEMKRHSPEGVKDHKEVVVRESKQTKAKLRSHSKSRSPSPVNLQQQHKGTVDKKVDRTQKVVSTSKKLVEGESVKNLSGSQVEVKLTSTKLKKPESGPAIAKNHSSRRQSTTSKTISKHATQRTTHNSKDQKEKLAGGALEAKLTNENVQNKECDGRNDLNCDENFVPEATTTMLADQLCVEKEANASGFQNGEHCSDSQSSLHKNTFLTPECEEDTKEVDTQFGIITTDTTIFRTRNDMKSLLLSTPSFISHSEELFNLNITSPKCSTASGTNDCEVTDVRLSLDCANEVIERRSLPDSQTRHPLLPIYLQNCCLCLSLDQLLEEVCNGVETLRSYTKRALDNPSNDSVYAIIETDISGKGVVTGMWDLGWWNGFSVDAAEEAVNDIERLLVTDLIEEVFA